MSGFDNDVVNCKNWDYRQTSPVQGQATSGGDLPIGTGGSPEIEVGQIVSSDSTLDVSYSNPNIDVTAGSVIATSYTGDTGTAIPVGNQLKIEGDVNITTTANSNVVTISSASSVTSVNTTYTAQESDYFINCTANTFAVTLPAAASLSGKQYQIKNTGSGTITIDGNGTETIDGDLTQTLAQDESMTLICDGSNWFII